MIIHIKMGFRFRGYLLLRNKAHQKSHVSLIKPLSLSLSLSPSPLGLLV
jgi:hypothetical protein